MGAVYKKELRVYFSSMTGYIVLSMMLIVAGFSCWLYNLYAQYAAWQASLTLVCYTLLFVVPILTMRSLAEERRSRTDQLLFSLPMRVRDMVLGKYLAMVTVFAVPCGVMGLFPLILSMYGTVALGAAYASLLAFFLLGCALIAVGMFMSSLTESQIIAAVLSFLAILLCFLTGSLAGMLPATALANYIEFTVVIALFCLLLYSMTKNCWIAIGAAFVLEGVLSAVYLANRDLLSGAFAKVLKSLSVFDRLSGFLTSGLFDLTALLYFLSVAGLFVFFTVQSVEKKRWA